MTLRVLYFAGVKEKVGVSEEHCAPPPETTTVSDLVEWLKAQSSNHAAAFADSDQIRVAIDQVHCSFDSPIAGASEVAFFPPVTGG